MISSAKDDRSWTTIHSDGPASRGARAATLAAFLAGLLALLAAGPAAAQTTITLVGNKAETPTGDLAVNATIAQGFRTGSNSAGYTLSRIDMVSNDSDSDAFSVALYTTDSNGLPNTQSVALTAPDNFTAGVLSFAAPAGTTLAANTHYSLVITRGTGVTFLTLDGTTSDGETGLTGWSLANAHSTLSGSTWSNAASGISLRVAIKGYAKSPPVFNPTAVTRAFAENTAAGQNVGEPVSATDADTGDTLSYTLGGTDDAAFDIVETSGQIRTKAGVSYDHEAKASYSVTVTASDGTASADATVTINVSDVAEPPLAPDRPIAVAVPRTYDQISVRWFPPENSGRPEITGYDVQYEDFDPELDDFVWLDGPQVVDGTSVVISDLLQSTPYPVRVRAKNDEGEGPWSPTELPDTNRPPVEFELGAVQIPSGFGPGDSFHLLFVTSFLVGTYSAAADRITDYRDFLFTDTQGAYFPELASITVLPLASTRHVDARVVTNTTWTDSDRGVPIYWVGGSKVADDYADFYDGDWDDETNVRDHDGQLFASPPVV